MQFYDGGQQLTHNLSSKTRGHPSHANIRAREQRKELWGPTGALLQKFKLEVQTKKTVSADVAEMQVWAEPMRPHIFRG